MYIIYYSWRTYDLELSHTSASHQPHINNRAYHALQLMEKNAWTDSLLEDYVFYIMPNLNPDGYEYTHTHVSAANL